MRLQPLNRFGRWGVFQQPARIYAQVTHAAVFINMCMCFGRQLTSHAQHNRTKAVIVQVEKVTQTEHASYVSRVNGVSPQPGCYVRQFKHACSVSPMHGTYLPEQREKTRWN